MHIISNWWAQGNPWIVWAVVSTAIACWEAFMAATATRDVKTSHQRRSGLASWCGPSDGCALGAFFGLLAMAAWQWSPAIRALWGLDAEAAFGQIHGLTAKALVAVPLNIVVVLAVGLLLLLLEEKVQKLMHGG